MLIRVYQSEFAAAINTLDAQEHICIDACAAPDEGMIALYPTDRETIGGRAMLGAEIVMTGVLAVNACDLRDAVATLPDREIEVLGSAHTLRLRTEMCNAGLRVTTEIGLDAQTMPASAQAG